MTTTVQDARRLTPPAGAVARTFGALLWRDVFVTGREFPSFLAQVVLQPFLMLFVFGRVLSELGLTRPGYATLLVPGVISLTLVLTALQSTALPLVIDFSFTKEIEDRLLAPIPVGLVAVEKMIFATMRSLIAGLVMVPIAIIVIPHLHLSTSYLGTAAFFAVLGGLAGSTMGMMLGTLVPVNRINLMFSLVLTPLLFTGCVQYPWPSLVRLPWFKALTLLNPMTYASEGLRAALVPYVPHMNTAVAAIVLPGWIVVYGLIGIRGFLRRAID